MKSFLAHGAGPASARLTNWSDQIDTIAGPTNCPSSSFAHDESFRLHSSIWPTPSGIVAAAKKPVLSRIANSLDRFTRTVRRPIFERDSTHPIERARADRGASPNATAPGPSFSALRGLLRAMAAKAYASA